jgi:metacaspase-1
MTSAKEAVVAKRALCIGINDYPYAGSDLLGCVNDAQAWAALLTGHFDFPPSDVVVLTDGAATKRGIVAGIERLLTGAAPGDTLVLTNSSHGSYRLDRDGDEERADELLCPHDVDANVILDDELRGWFAAVPRGVHLVAVLDNCHSGTGTRGPSANARPRFLPPGCRGERERAGGLAGSPTTAPDPAAEEAMREILLSGCMAHESSYDDLIEGTYHGAMTFHALATIREYRYRLTYDQLHRRLLARLGQAGYDQHPQLEGPAARKQQQVFA